MELVTEGLRFPEGPVAMPDGSVVLVEIERGWSGTGVDNACGTAGPHVADMEDAAPRHVRISRRP